MCPPPLAKEGGHILQSSKVPRQWICGIITGMFHTYRYCPQYTHPLEDRPLYGRVPGSAQRVALSTFAIQK